jgi:hypothetical protein
VAPSLFAFVPDLAGRFSSKRRAPKLQEKSTLLVPGANLPSGGGGGGETGRRCQSGMQLWRRLEWRKKSREIHDNGAEGDKYFFGTRRACAQCPHREEEESVREATDGGTLRGCTDGVESVWRCEQRGLEMLPVRGLRDDGAPARHTGGDGGSGLQCRGRRLGAAAAPQHRRSMVRRRCSVLFAVHQWTGERGTVMRHGWKRPSGPPL